MRRDPMAAALLLTGALLAGGCQERPPTAGVVRVMPLGDSITDGFNVPGGYRTALWRSLTGAGRRVDFVGSRSDGPADLPDRDHEGHPGWRIDEIDAQVTGWVTAAEPGIVLIHLGTNDVVQDHDMARAPERLGALVDHIAAVAPGAELYVCSIVPLADPVLEARAAAFNAAVPGIVRMRAAAGVRVRFVDQHAALSVGDLADGVHPTRAGYDRMAAAWAAALAGPPG